MANQVPPPTKDIGNLQTLRTSLLPSSLADLVFVAIDFERPQYIIDRFRRGRLDTQVGLAILDTRSLSSTSKITTFNFITEEDAYFEDSAPSYHWGTAEKITSKSISMLSKINDCLRTYQNRSIVFVGHGVANDLAALKAPGWFDFQENLVVSKMDTYILAKRDLQMGDFTLKNLLLELDCPAACNNVRFHNAGNDANLALRALLLLCIKAINIGTTSESNEAEAETETAERVRILWWIAMNGVISRKRRNICGGRLRRHGRLRSRWRFE